MRTNFYIDGFNLYYGCLKGTPHKWLDLAAFCRSSFPPPRNQVNRIRYFTAHVKARPNDPQQPIRQQTYLRALRTIPHLTIHLGSYLEKPTAERDSKQLRRSWPSARRPIASIMSRARCLDNRKIAT